VPTKRLTIARILSCLVCAASFAMVAWWLDRHIPSEGPLALVVAVVVGSAWLLGWTTPGPTGRLPEATALTLPLMLPVDDAGERGVPAADAARPA
jgi:hypothetical protein